MGWASRGKAILSQWEGGAGLVPGGGPMARLPRLVGRGRAMEVLLGADDISGELAERYGYVNRALPDVDLDGFVDALARRIARSEEHTSELQSLMRTSYAVFCLKNKQNNHHIETQNTLNISIPTSQPHNHS